ncbi:enoyl-CoA hydratase-related protein [Amycolatopsis rhabdoformis]|uniref:Enoyl-CoA hydratase-related protein n=1 Tax=Amycolatopsis rhabdoformis TaxID=1448059 RepID=A0ABZ1I8X2_9PSEU|nr:enoyl-CoA hydratase-related protein [Amycolatopsis rhabdoformis]WSE29860.1 enoyl-CoA hydratase-related protein [Amycolatopsis rhabdoformis]
MSALELTVSGGVATLRINRPEKRNAMTSEMWRQVPSLIASVAADDAVRVLVLTGEPHFSAGADIGEFGRVRSDPARGRAYDAVVEEAEQALTRLGKPTIAAVRGYCIGGGCELALACDLRVAAAGARFAITPAKVGLVYSLTGVQRLVDTVGPAWAKQLLFTAEQISASTAERIGLVNEVVPDDRLADRVSALAASIRHGARTSVTGAKFLVERLARSAVPDAATAALYDQAYSGADYAEGVAAFLEKRPPSFD